MNAVSSPHETPETLETPQYPLSTVTEFNTTELALADFRAQYQDLVFNVATPAGLEEAKKARRFLVTARTSLDKRRKELKADIIVRGKLIDGEAGRITAQIEDLEGPIDAQIKKREAEQEEIRQAKMQAEAQRQAAIHQRIEAIRNHGATVTTPLGELQRILARLQATDITQADFEEHVPMATLTKAATIDQVQALINERQVFEAAQAEAKRQQEAEAQRIAAEREAQATEQARLAELQAALANKEAAFKREFEEFEAAKRKAAEAEMSKPVIEAVKTLEDVKAQAEAIISGQVLPVNDAVIDFLVETAITSSQEILEHATATLNKAVRHISEEETIISGLMHVLYTTVSNYHELPEYIAAAAYMARVKS